MPEIKRKNLFNITDFPNCCGAVIAYNFHGDQLYYDRTPTAEQIYNEIQDLRKRNKADSEMKNDFHVIDHQVRACMIAITIPKQKEVEKGIEDSGGILVYSYDNVRMGEGNINNVWAIPLL